MNDSATIQQIVDKINSSSNVLIAVSDNPTLDALSAAIALALTLNKLDKHGTAVFSGKVPTSLTFLNPEKTLEPNTNSLRDFIISLDKQKADHLRYKIEGDFVKIYITPYRTTINKEDLEFTVGNLNMDLVIALGVYDNKHLDNALFVHGRVLHDSTIISLSKGEPASKIGTIEWHEADASSLCEMVEAIIEPFNTEKKVMDKQIATALLAGIVAETDRFANEKTNANSMTVAAKLMAAGANQQLIAAKLSIHPTINPPDLKVELSKRLTEDKESVMQFIVDHKDDTLEEITNTAKNKPSSAVFNRENNLASPAVEVEPSVKVNHKDIAMDTVEPQINLQESAGVSPAENIDFLEPKTKIIEPTKDFIESSVVNPPMSASMVTTLVSKPDIFEKPPSAFDSMVFNPNPAGVAPANINPVSTLNQQPSNITDLNQTTPTNVSNEQSALAAVHASFDGVPTLPLPPPVPNFTQQSQSPSPVEINPVYSTEQTPQTKPQNPTDPTQFQIPV